MLLKTTIYNRNYYPIKVNTVNERILNSDKLTTSNDQYINASSFNNESGLLIKPFQNIEYFSSVSLNNNIENFNDTIYLDSTLYTDSVDYGKFGILTGQDANIQHHFVTIKTSNLIKETNGIVTNKYINSINDNDIISVKFSMKDINDQNDIINNMELSGFSGYEIENYTFFGEGINAISILSKYEESCTNQLFRGSLIKSQNDIIEYIESNGYKCKLYKENNNIFIDLEMSGIVFKNLILSANTAYKDMITSDEYTPSKGIDTPMLQQSIGMSVILQLKTNSGNTPYKINLKIISPILIFPEDTENISIPIEYKNEIKPILNTIDITSQGRNDALMISPSKTKLLTNPNSFYSAIINIYPISFNSLSTENNDIEDNSFYTINNIRQKNQDYYTDNNLITFISPELPIKKIIPVNSNYINNNNLSILIDTTGIIENYINTIIINYTYDNTNYNIETDISIEPILKSGLPELEYVPNSILVENSYKHELKQPIDYGSILIDTIHFSTIGEDKLQFYIKNIGEENAIIDNIEIENSFKFINDILLKEEKTDDDIKNIELLNNYNNYHLNAMTYLGADSTDIDNFTNIYSIKKYISFTIDKIEQPQYNAFNSNYFKIYFKINKFKIDNNLFNGTPLAIKVSYRKIDSPIVYTKYLCDKYEFCLKFIIGKMELLYNKSIENTKYLKPYTRNSIFIDLYKKVTFDNIWTDIGNLISNSITIKNCEIENINYDNGIERREFSFNENQFPLSVSELNNIKPNTMSIDFNLENEKIYKFKLKIYTSYEFIKYIEIPMTVISSNIDIDDIIKFNPNDFYVKNNKYFLSLKKLETKNRTLEIINTSNIDIIVNELSSYTITDKFNTNNFDIKIKTKVKLPFTITNKNSLKLNIDFIGKDFGHFSNFILLKTELGDIYLNIASFVNTKYKDVFVLMENIKGTKFKAAVSGIDIDYIKLINFGDDKCSTEITKLGQYYNDNFKIANSAVLLPNTINYIENVFKPNTTGKKINYANFKLNDMLETFNLLSDENTYISKIQNSNIIAEMVGISLSENSLPIFDKSVIDFGYFSIDNKNKLLRIDTINITNYGLSPFIITKVSNINENSHFKILIGNNLPLKVEKEISIPIYINKNYFNSNDNIYYDIIKFEMQDLKTKKIISNDIIVKIELSEHNKTYISLNSEFLEFGYCEINNFKTDNLTIKNFSTKKLNLAVSYEGDIELQTLYNTNINIWENQTFTLPIYFYPHSLGEFMGKIKLSFDNDNFIKYIDLFGYGVDFKLPLTKIKNDISKYVENIQKYLNK